jgi:hypothetical protein
MNGCRRWLRVSSLVLPLLVAFSVGAPRAEARELADGDGRSSIGVTLGEPFGLSFKRYMGGNAFDVNLALAYGPGVRLGADYLWQLGLLHDHSTLQLNAYAGLGPFIGSFVGPCNFDYGFNRCGNGYNSGVYLGGRVPLGLEAVFNQAPIAIGLEIAPALAFGPGRSDYGVGYLLDALIAIRFLF